MRILMLLEGDFPPDVRVEKEALSLIRNGHTVTIATNTLDNKPLPDTFKGINIIRKRISDFQYKSSVGSLRFQFYFNFWRQFIKEIFRTSTYDIIHVHDLPLAQIGYEVKMKYGIPFILDLHENYPALLNISTHTKKFLARFLYSYKSWKNYEQKMVQLADFVICVVEEMKQRLADFGINKDKIFVVENTPDLSTFVIPDSRPDTDYNTLFYSGGINKHRGIQYIINGLPPIIEEYPNTRLWIVGSGSYKPAIEKMVIESDLQDVVTFFGWRKQVEMAELLMKSDIALIPHSKSDHTDHTLPNKLHEYAMAQKPVVSSDCNPLIRMINEMQNGFIYKYDSPDDFARVIKKLLESGEKQKMGANGKSWVETKYNWTFTEKNLFALYNEISKTR